MIYLYWLLPIPVLVSMLVLMYRRKQHYLYRVFWSYLCFQCVRLGAEALSFSYSRKAYFYAYWTGSVCSILLSLLLLRDIFVTVLRSYPSLSRIRSIGYEIALACVWTAAVFIALQDANAHTYQEVITRLWQTVSFTSVGIFIFVVISSSILGIKWTDSVCGVAAGLGLLGTVDLLVYAALSHPQAHFSVRAAGYTETAAYYGAVAVFAFYFLPKRVESKSLQPKPELIDWAQSMNGTLSR